MTGTPRVEQRRQAAVLAANSSLASCSQESAAPLCSNPEWEPISVGGALQSAGLTPGLRWRGGPYAPPTTADSVRRNATPPREARSPANAGL
jgi:hypothetical protein